METLEGDGDDNTTHAWSKASSEAQVHEPQFLRITRCESHVLDELSGLRWYCARVVKTELFDMIIMFVVVLNLVHFIHDTDLRSKNITSEFATISGYAFMVVYAVELAGRIHVDRWSYFRRWSNRFDFFIVIIDIATEILDKVTPMPSVGFLRLFRVMKLLRVVRRMESFRELWLMLHGLASALKAMSWACVLITIVLTFFSIVAVMFIKPVHLRLQNDDRFANCPACIDAFDTVLTSFQTWFYIIFVGDLWVNLVIPIGEEEGLLLIIFFVAFVSINLGIMNLILTVIVDRAAAARADDEAFKIDEKRGDFMSAQKRLHKEVQNLDVDASGHVSLDELRAGFDAGGTFASTLKAMDVEKNDLETVFSILDDDMSGHVTYNEFVSQLYKIKTQESHTLLVFIKHYVLELRRDLSALKADLIGREEDVPPSEPTMGCAESSDFVREENFSSSLSVADKNMVICHNDIFVGEANLVTPTDADCSRMSDAELVKDSQTKGPPLALDTNGQLGRWRKHSPTSKLDTSPVKVNFVEIAGPNELSTHPELAVCAELRRLSQKIEHALSVFLTSSAEL